MDSGSSKSSSSISESQADAPCICPGVPPLVSTYSLNFSAGGVTDATQTSGPGTGSTGHVLAWDAQPIDVTFLRDCTWNSSGFPFILTIDGIASTAFVQLHLDTHTDQLSCAPSCCWAIILESPHHGIPFGVFAVSNITLAAFHGDNPTDPIYNAYDCPSYGYSGSSGTATVS